MKNITKDNKGITLVALIITIITMLILTSAIVYTGLDTYKLAKVNAFVTEMQLIQTKVDELIASKSMEELLKLGAEINSNTAINSAYTNGEISTNDYNAYRYFNKDSLLKIMNIDEPSSAVMINFSSREVVSSEGVEYKEKKHYTQYKLPGGQTLINSNEIERNLSFAIDETIRGLNATIKISDIKITNGTLEYKEQNESYWNIITNYTENSKTYEIPISRTGTYIVKLKDNNNIEKYIEKIVTIILTNEPKIGTEIQSYNYALSSQNWAYATDANGKNYVWIPRFAYKTDDQTNTTEIKYVKGNSNIATDNTYINENWKIHNKFTTHEGMEITGIWVKVDNLNQDGIELIALLDSNEENLIEIRKSEI